jgi:hypothetical protein
VNNMHLTSVGLAIVAGLVGIKAALCWHKAATISIEPGVGIHSGDIHTQDIEWLGATMENIHLSSSLNRRAAIWTAIAVLLSTLSTVIGAFS